MIVGSYRGYAPADFSAELKCASPDLLPGLSAVLFTQSCVYLVRGPMLGV